VTALADVLSGIDPDGPGAALAIVRNGEVADFAARGLANVEHDIPIGRETVHYLASTSKQFVACSIALLEADGKLSIEDDVRDYMPELSRLPETVQIFHLVHHTSGIRDKYALATIGGLPEESYATDAGTLALLSRQRTLNFPPGSRFMYSNSGYFLLAQIVARVSGCSFREFASERIFRPIGMSSTLFRDDPDEPIAHRASGHRAGPDGTWRLAEYRYPSLGPGGAWSTADDPPRWTTALDRDEPLPLDRPPRTRPLTGGSPNTYGFGLVASEYRGRRVQEHAGGVQGHTADFVRFPDEGVTVVCFANGGTSAPTLSRRAADVAFGDAVSEAPDERPQVEPDTASLCGVYCDADEAGVITIETSDDGLSVRYGRIALPVHVVGPRELEGPAGLTFNADDGGLMLRGADSFGIRFNRLPGVTRPAGVGDRGRFVSDELDVVLEVDVEGAEVRVSRNGGEPSVLRAVADNLYLWPTSALGQDADVPLRIVRDDSGRAVALRAGTGRAIGVEFVRG